MYIFRQQRSFGMGRIPYSDIAGMFRPEMRNKKNLMELLHLSPEQYANRVTKFRDFNKVAIDPLEEKARKLKSIKANFTNLEGDLTDGGLMRYIDTVSGGKFGYSPRTGKLYKR